MKYKTDQSPDTFIENKSRKLLSSPKSPQSTSFFTKTILTSVLLPMTTSFAPFLLPKSISNISIINHNNNNNFIVEAKEENVEPPSRELLVTLSTEYHIKSEKVMEELRGYITKGNWVEIKKKNKIL